MRCLLGLYDAIPLFPLPVWDSEDRRSGWTPNLSSPGGAWPSLDADFRVESSRDLSVPDVRGQVTAREHNALAAQISPVDSSTLDRAPGPPLSHPHGETIDRPVASDKLFRELRNRQIPTASASNARASEPTEPTAEVPTPDFDFYGYPVIVYRRGLRRETDGGVRLGGGRPGEDPAPCGCDHWRESTSPDASILPPSYSSDFGEA